MVFTYRYIAEYFYSGIDHYLIMGIDELLLTSSNLFFTTSFLFNEIIKTYNEQNIFVVQKR